MPAATRSLARPFADSSASTIVAGFIAMLTGYTSSLVLMFQAGQAAGLSSAQISSWIWALSIGMAICSIGLSMRYHTPVVIAWSTPGAALLISSLPGVPYAEAIGAFIFASLLIALCGLTGSFERLMRKVPASLAAALLAGVLFNIGSEIFRAVKVQPLLVLAMFFSYLLAKRLAPRYAVLSALLVGCALSAALGLLDFRQLSLQIAVPVWTTPSLSIAAVFSIGIPLFVIAMASQNMPGLAVLRAEGYQVPASPLISVTGIASVLLAPFGSHGIHLAAITMAICSGPEAHPDRDMRWPAPTAAGVVYLLLAGAASLAAAFIAAAPPVLIQAVAGLALLSSLAAALSGALADEEVRLPAIFTFVTTASGITIAGLGGPFWGLLGGIAILLLLRTGRITAR